MCWTVVIFSGFPSVNLDTSEANDSNVALGIQTMLQGNMPSSLLCVFGGSRSIWKW